MKMCVSVYNCNPRHKEFICDKRQLWKYHTHDCTNNELPCFCLTLAEERRGFFLEAFCVCGGGASEKARREQQIPLNSVIGGCETPNVVLGNKQRIWEEADYAQPLRHFSHPEKEFY